MSLVVEAKNYRGLVDISWAIPPGLSVVVGANGAGKTTLLFLLDLLRSIATRDDGLAAAVEFYGGTRALKHLGDPAGPLVLGARTGDLAWRIAPLVRDGGLMPFAAESLRKGDEVIFDREPSSPVVMWQDKPVKTDGRSVLRRLAAADLQGSFKGRPLLDELEGCRIYHDYNLWRVRQGSEDSAHTWLQRNGINVFSVLRNWRDWTPDRPRYEFVVESLRECFGFFGDFDFQKGGNTVECWIVHRQYRSSFPAGGAANGWLVALLHLTAIAGASAGQVVGLDDFEYALHPRALLRVLDLIKDYAAAKGISVVLTSQSTTVLDWFEEHPEHVFVLDPRYHPGPRPLTELRNEQWLSHFRLGRKYADGDFGGEEL